MFSPTPCSRIWPRWKRPRRPSTTPSSPSKRPSRRNATGSTTNPTSSTSAPGNCALKPGKPPAQNARPCSAKPKRSATKPASSASRRRWSAKFTEYAKRALNLNHPDKPPTVAAYDGYCTNEAAIKVFEAPKPSLRASATKLRTGELAELQFKIDNLRSWKGKITWTGEGLDPEQTKEASWSNTFKADKEGQYTITANFSGDGQDHSASVTLSVSGGVTGRLYGLGDREYFGATRKLKLMLQTTPGQNLDDDPCIQRYRRNLEEQQALDACLQANRKLPEAKRKDCKVPPRFDLNECGVSGTNLVGATGYHILWNASPNLKFKARETEIDNTEVTLDRMTDNLPVWAELRTKQGGFYETVGRTENHDLEVIPPTFRFKYNPSPAEAVVGKPIQVSIVAEPAVSDELIDYRWVEPVDRKELPEKGVIEIIPKDSAPLETARHRPRAALRRHHRRCHQGPVHPRPVQRAHRIPRPQIRRLG
ncbi:MAG: hypothetical protein IPG66_00285 [Hydrogenophilales bacterium]|nr:hypothetical protein [Hydrogenophilales bacterium]